MKGKIIKLAILVGAIFVFLLFLLKIASLQRGQIRKVKTSRPTVLPTPTLRQKKEEGIKVWLEEKAPDRLLLLGNSGTGKYDTLQLVFKSKEKTVKDFIPLPSSDFILRLKTFKDEEVIFLFSTGGGLERLEADKPLGELFLFPGTDASDLIIDQNRTKIVKSGKEFPIDFEGVKK